MGNDLKIGKASLSRLLYRRERGLVGEIIRFLAWAICSDVAFLDTEMMGGRGGLVFVELENVAGEVPLAIHDIDDDVVGRSIWWRFVIATRWSVGINDCIIKCFF